MQVFVMFVVIMVVMLVLFKDTFKASDNNHVKLRDRRLVAAKTFIVGGHLIPKGTVGAFIPRSVEIPSFDMPFWIEESASITGDCTIGFNTYIGSDTILSDCTIMSNVVVGKKCQIYHTTIMDGASLKEYCICYDSVIGRNSTIDYSCTIKSSTIAWGVYVGFRSTVAHTTIGKKTKIDNDTGINRSVIGEYCCSGKLMQIDEMCIPNICTINFDDSFGKERRVLDSTICVPYYCNDYCYLLLFMDGGFYISGALTNAISLSAKCMVDVPVSVIDKFSSISKNYTKV